MARMFKRNPEAATMLGAAALVGVGLWAATRKPTKKKSTSTTKAANWEIVKPDALSAAVKADDKLKAVQQKQGIDSMLAWSAAVGLPATTTWTMGPMTAKPADAAAYTAEFSTKFESMKQAAQPVVTVLTVAEKGKPLSETNVGNLSVQVGSVDTVKQMFSGKVIKAVATPNITGVPTDVTAPVVDAGGFFFPKPKTTPSGGDEIPDPGENKPNIALKDPLPWATEGAGIDLSTLGQPGGGLDPATLVPMIASGVVTDANVIFEQGPTAAEDLLNVWLDANEPAPGSSPMPSTLVYLVAMTRRDDASDARGLATFQVVGADPERGVARVILVMPPALAAGREGIVYEFPISVFGGGIAIQSESGFGPVGPRPLPPRPGM